MARWERKAARERLAEILRLVGLEGMENRHPHQLSGSRAQRVALAGAMAPRARILLLDEPLANLDAALVAGMLDLNRQVQSDTGVTRVFVAHDRLIAAAVCQRALVLQAVLVVQRGTWTDVEIVSVSELVPQAGTEPRGGKPK